MHAEKAPSGVQELLSFVAQPRFRRLNKIDFARFASFGDDARDHAAQLCVLRALDFSHLTELHVTACGALDDAVLAEVVLAGAGSLRILDIARCHALVRISGTALRACTGLEVLRVAEMYGKYL